MRENGFYWVQVVKDNPRWVVREWVGKRWFRGVEQAEEPVVVGERIPEPKEPLVAGAWYWVQIPWENHMTRPLRWDGVENWKKLRIGPRIDPWELDL